MKAVKQSPREREALQLRKAGLTIPQIAKKMGIHSRKVAEHLSRARKREKPNLQVKRGAQLQGGALDLSKEKLAKEIDALELRLRVKEVRTQDLLSLVGSRAQAILETISPQDILGASLKDKVIAAAILIEKRQLLSGEPTQILTVQERGKLDDLVKLVFAEAKKRGLVVDTTGISVQMEDVKLLPPQIETLGLDPSEQRRRRKSEHKEREVLQGR